MPSKNKKSLSENPFEGIEIDDLTSLAEKTPTQTQTKPSKPAQKPRQGLGEELIGVYESSGEDFRTISAFEHKARTWQRWLVWILLFVVAVFVGVASVSYFIWGRQPVFNGDRVVFDIQAPEQAKSGSPVTYVLHYANKEGISFSKSEIEVRYPLGFHFVSAKPEPNSGQNLFSLGSVAAMAEGTIEINGLLVGKPEQATTISGVWRYWPSNFSSEFQEVASAQTQMQPLDIEARLEGPDQVLVGQKTSYTLIYNNTGKESINDVRLNLVFPAGFVVDTAKPTLDEDKEHFTIASLEPNQELELQIDGFYSQASDQPVDFIVEISQKATEDEFFAQKQLTHQTKIIRGDLVVNVIANGSNKDTSVQWGAPINASISFQNNSEAVLSDLKVVAKLESRYRTNTAGKGNQGALDWSTLVDSHRGSLKEQPATDNKTLRSRTITWTGEEVEALSKLESKAEGSIDMQISLYDLVTAAKLLTHPEDIDVVMNVEITVGKTGGVQEQLKVIGNPITFAVSSDLALQASVRYFDKDGNQVGSGPLPPQVSQKTRYRVYWQLDNTLHEVADVLVSTELPDNVAWVNSFEVSAGEVVFTPSGNSLSWRLNRMPLDVKRVTLAFDVEVSPTAQQVGKVAPVTKKISLTATDTITSGKLIQTLSALTTGAEDDEEAADKGIVIR